MKCELMEGKQTNYIFCTETVHVPENHEAIIPSKLAYTAKINGLPLHIQSFVTSSDCRKNINQCKHGRCVYSCFQS